MRRAIAMMLAAIGTATLVACERVDSQPPCKCVEPKRDAAIVSDAADAAELPALAKQHTVERMLAQGPVLVRLDARVAGVVVRPVDANDPDFLVRIGNGLEPVIPDLVVDARGISATLAFDGKAVHCVVPWAAVYGLQLEAPAPELRWPAPR